MMSYLRSEDSVHRQDIHLLGDTKGWRDLGTKDVRSRELCQGRAFASRSVEYPLVSHVASGSRCNEEDFGIGRLEDSVFQGRANKAVGLTIPKVSCDTNVPCENSHCFGSESCSYHVDSLSSDCFTTLSIVIHTRLVIFRRVDGVSFTKLDFALFSQNIHLPSNKRVVVRIGIG
jgi:hypothetical protein